MTGYDFHPAAELDLYEIWDFIAEDNPRAADKVTADIVAALDKLVRFPYQGHTRTDLTSRPLRFWRVRDFLIAYAPDEKPLWVVAIIHGSRNPRVIAAILRSREGS
jgi:plasmid stabilization system protein ParE